MSAATDSFGPKALGAPLHLTVKPVDWWRRQMVEARLEILSGAAQQQPDGTPMWLYLLCRPMGGPEPAAGESC